jgi:hypothetical protein
MAIVSRCRLGAGEVDLMIVLVRSTSDRYKAETQAVVSDFLKIGLWAVGGLLRCGPSCYCLAWRGLVDKALWFGEDLGAIRGALLVL